MSSSYIANLPRQIQARLNEELKPGEIVVWAEQPNPWQFMKSTRVLWLFFIPWTAFAVFWITAASGFKLPDFSEGGFALFPLFGVPFLLVGLWGLSAPFRANKQALDIVYVITNIRALSIEGGKSVQYKSYYPEQIKQIVRKQNPDGSGDVTFVRETFTDSDGDRGTKDHGFFAIQNVKTVESLLEKLAREKAITAN